MTLEPAVEVLSHGPSRASEALARVQLGRAYALAGRPDDARVQLELASTTLRDEQGDYKATLATIAAVTATL